jgi:glycine cleavage system H protein
LVVVEDFVFPDELLYTTKHVWVKVEDKTAIVGVTSLGQSLAKGIVHVDLPVVGQKVRRNEVVASFETIKAVVRIPSPLTGKIVEVNERLLDNPETINKDPYGEGWLFKISLRSKSEVRKLLTAKKASTYFKKFLKKEREKYAG